MERIPVARRPTRVGLHQARTACIRGGSWDDDAFGCRTAFRYYVRPDVQRLRFWVPLRPAPRSVSRNGKSGAGEASEGRAKPDCGGRVSEKCASV